jgi:dihydroorotate dehydrogenase (NAD+) catalytic subunit
MLREPMYNPRLSYEENYERGPFGDFRQPKVMEREAEQSAPRFSFLGAKVWQPLGIPAGPLVNGHFVKAALDKGFDIPVYKTVRTHAYKSHPWPNVLPVRVAGDLRKGCTLVAEAEYDEPLSITNSFGVPSMDPDVWQADLADCAAHARAGQLVVGSFQGTLPEGGGRAEYIADFRLGARQMRETGVRAVEVNFSCPNEGTANLLCFDVARSREVVEAIREELGDTPLMIKIAYFEDDETLEALVRAVGPHVHAISAINTVSAKIVNQQGEQALPGEGRLMSGVCGQSIRWAGLQMTAKLRRLREELGLAYEISGVGGVMNAEDFVAYRKAGADAVMSATGAMWNPGLAEEIWKHEIAEVNA